MARDGATRKWGNDVSDIKAVAGKVQIARDRIDQTRTMLHGANAPLQEAKSMCHSVFQDTGSRTANEVLMGVQDIEGAVHAGIRHCDALAAVLTAYIERLMSI